MEAVQSAMIPGILSLDDAEQTAAGFYDERYDMSKQHRKAWKWWCSEAELTAVGPRLVYRVRIESEYRGGCFRPTGRGYTLDIQVDAETGQIVGHSRTGWSWGRTR